MTGARLVRARLVDDELRNASGHNVGLSGARLERLNLRHGWLAGINLAGARLIKSQPPDNNQDAATKDPNCVKAQ